MAISYLDYHLNNGYVQNWLVAGPEAVSVPDLSTFQKDKLATEILSLNFTPDSGVKDRPVDAGYLDKEKNRVDVENLAWSYYRCTEDHLIDFSSLYNSCTYLKAWAFVEVEMTQAQNTTLTLTTNGPADFWLNDIHVHRQEHYQKQKPAGVSFPTTFQAGKNRLLFRFETVGIRETPFVFALHFEDSSDEDIKVMIPMDIEEEYYEKRKVYEDVIYKAYLDRYVYGWFSGDVYDKNEPVTVRFSQDLKVSPPITVIYRLQSLNADIFQEGKKDTDASTVYELAKNYPLRNGPHQLEILPESGLYYVKKLRVRRDDNFYIARSPYSNKPYSIIHERRREAIEDASKRRGESIFTEISKMLLGQWDKIINKVVQKSLDRINRRDEDSIIDLLGLTGLFLRNKKNPDFPKTLRSSIETCLLNYKYWEDEPGSDIMDFQTESRQLLYHVAEILAGQIFITKSFSNSNQTGKWHCEKGERLAHEWLVAHGTYGWQDWDSPIGFEEELAGLSYLIDFANSYQIVELASIMTDKMLFALAINSFQGSFGSTHNRVDTASILSSRLEPTSGISRIMWGMGNINEHLFGTISIACMKKYDFPNPIKNIASHQEDGFWDRERQGASYPVVTHAKQDVNKVTYKTNDYMLSSSQDYAPFSKGCQEHIWQATLGPDAIVFVNHPACISEKDSHKPNFWRGNQTLPRVAQWGDTLIGLYKVSDDDWLGFTHAYFPTAIFDAYKLVGHWAFAKKDKAYLALYSSNEFEFITKGQSAYRELRTSAKENIWFCQMGQELLDGSFEDFQKKISELDIQINDLNIQLKNLRGDEIHFGPDQPLFINGQEQPLSDFKHYENKYSITEYPSNTMDIGFKDQGIRLSFTE